MNVNNKVEADNLVLNLRGMSAAPPGMAGRAEVGEMSSRLLEILSGVERLRTVESMVEAEVGNLEVYIKEVVAVCKQFIHLVGKNLVQEPLCFARMITAVGGSAGVGGS